MRSLRDMRNTLRADLPLYRGSFAESRLSTIAGAFEGNE
jgi:hypothetical protein